MLLIRVEAQNCGVEAPGLARLRQAGNRGEAHDSPNVLKEAQTGR